MGDQKRFTDRVVAGEIDDPVAAVDDAIAAWHADETTDVELHEYLGLTWEEYTAFVARPSALLTVVARRKQR